ncbi:ankyrin repeat domain-containing protein [Acidobacteria bacterium AH-259-D05]|nr:ankyrin repeat domain-containing protein [Acidobacteria bacterium AH-259-D05]
MQALIDAGAEVDRSNSKGGETWTPLIYAAKGGHKVTVKVLLDAGADVNSERGGMTALKMATSQGYTHLEQLLQEAGARE